MRIIVSDTSCMIDLNNGTQIQFSPLVFLAGRGELYIDLAVILNQSDFMAEHIVIDPGICHGKPVIHGTRVPVSIVVGSLAGGMTFEEVQHEYDLTPQDIRAALKFASELVDQESFHPLTAA